MGAPLNKYGLQMSFPLIVFIDDNGLKIVIIWSSVVGDGVVSAHKVIPSSGCRCSFDSECVLWCIGDDDGDDPIRLTE